MALLLPGKTVCSLCGEVIVARDDVVATPPFLESTHRLARFSDAAFHRRCFEEAAEHAEVENLLMRFKEKMATGPRTLEEYESWLKDSMRDSE